MTLSRDQQREIIDKIVADQGLRSLSIRAGWNKNRRTEWRRVRVHFLVDYVSVRVNAGIKNSPGLKENARQAFEKKFGSAILMFIAFQLIWWAIEKYILNRA